MPRLINRFMRVLSYNFIRQSVSAYLEIRSPKIFQLLNKHKTVVKYVLAGGTAVVVNLSLLYLLTELFEIWYIISSIIAFSISLLTGFVLQKFWTFRDNNARRFKRQLAMYITVGILNLILDPVLLYALVETFGIWYVLAQLLVMAVLAIESYLINRFITFKKDIPHESFNV